MATYNFECFEYLLSSFAIGLKERCLSFVEKQLRELAEKVHITDNVLVTVYNDVMQDPSEGLSEQIEEFIVKQDDSLDNVRKQLINTQL